MNVHHGCGGEEHAQAQASTLLLSRGILIPCDIVSSLVIPGYPFPASACWHCVRRRSPVPCEWVHLGWTGDGEVSQGRLGICEMKWKK